MIVFLYILIFLLVSLFILLVSSIEINIENITIDNHEKIALIFKTLLKEKNTVNKFNVLDYISFKMKIKILIFNKIPIVIIKKNNYDLKQTILRQYKKEMKKAKKAIEKDKVTAKRIWTKVFPKVVVKETNLQMNIGTDNAAFTAIITSLFNIIISLTLPHIADIERAEKYRYDVQPMYLNKNVFFLHFSGIIALKIVHIMKVICEKEEKIENE